MAEEKKKISKNSRVFCGLSVKTRQERGTSVPTLHLSESLNVLQTGIQNVLYLKLDRRLSGVSLGLQYAGLIVPMGE